MILPWLGLVDLGTGLSRALRLKKHVYPLAAEARDEDFTIVIPLYKGAWPDEQLLERIAHLGTRVAFAIPTGEEELARRVEQQGYRAIRFPLARKELTKWRSLRVAIGSVNTGYVFFMDADTYPSGSDLFPRLVQTLREHDLDVASLYILPSTERSTVERLQKVEYVISMGARAYRPWNTSGACIAGKTSSVQRVLANHSGFEQGDMEFGLIATHLNLSVGHIPEAVFFTRVPSTWAAWARQRTRWWGGLFRRYVLNVRMQRSLFMTAYYWLVVWFLLPWKVLEVVATQPLLQPYVPYSSALQYLLLYSPPSVPLIATGTAADIVLQWPFFWLLLLYVPITYVNTRVNRRPDITVSARAVALYPLYAFAQVTAVAFMGLVTMPFRKGGKLIRLREPRSSASPALSRLRLGGLHLIVVLVLYWLLALATSWIGSPHLALGPDLGVGFRYMAAEAFVMLVIVGVLTNRISRRA